MTSSREALVTVQSPVATAWNCSSVLQQKLFVEDSNWRTYRHPFSDRATWVASFSGESRYGHMTDVEPRERIVIEVVESDALVRLTWTFEPVEQHRTHLWQRVESRGLRSMKHLVLQDQIHQSGMQAMQAFQDRTRRGKDHRLHPSKGMHSEEDRSKRGHSPLRVVNEETRYSRRKGNARKVRTSGAVDRRQKAS